jgi:uncharacterized membrane protein YgcG
MNNRQNLPKVVLWLFLFSLVCGYAKSLAATGIEQGRQRELATIINSQRALKENLATLVQQAKGNHPKYTADLTVDNLIGALEQEKISLVKAGSGPDPRPGGEATAHAAKVLELVSAQGIDVMRLIAKLDNALASYASVEGNIRQDAKAVNNQIAGYMSQGYFKRHFTDAEIVTAQLISTAGDVATLMKRIDNRDNRPDYLRIYEIGRQSASISAQARALADTAPRLHQSVIEIVVSTETSRGSLIALLNEAFGAASRIERYSAYRSKGFSSGLREAQNTLDSIANTLSEVNHLNGMAVQDFIGAKTLLEQARKQIASTEAYINRVRQFDAQIRSAVASMASYRSSADSAIDRAQSYINQWNQNNQSSAWSELQSARSDFDTANLRESSDPISAANYYREAEAEAESAYNRVDTYTPPPPSSSSSSDSTSSSSSWGSSSSSYGSSGGSSGSSSSSMSGSYGGPSSGSYGKGD